jgi:phage head maturation protease
VRIAQTALGEETLELANEGALDASAGFLPMPGGESWHERRTMRRITKAWLGHIALTPDPAYLDARVLAVRTAEPVQVGTAERIATPLLDEVRSWRLREQFGSLTTE